MSDCKKLSRCFQNILVADVILSHLDTQIQVQGQLYITALQFSPQKPHTLAVYEPGSSVSEVDAMPTGPRH
jgi:hypothetical protein